MICCKIVTNYNSEQGKFQQLWETLAKRGDLLWENGTLYFADCKDCTTDSLIGKILKKCGYDNYFIDIYNKDNQPRFETEVANNWLNEKLIKINFNTYERANQEMLKNVSKGLDQLDEILDNIIIKNKEAEQEDTNGGGKEEE